MDDKKTHQLIAKNILVISALLFSVVLILTILTQLSYNESSLNQPNLSAFNVSATWQDELKNDEIWNKFNITPNSADDGSSVIKEEDNNLKEFLALLNSSLVQETRSNDQDSFVNDFASFGNNSTDLELEQDWQKNSALKIGDAIAQRLNRLAPEDDEMVRTVTNYQGYVYKDSDLKNYRLPVEETAGEENSRTYSDDDDYTKDYYDKLSKEKSDDTVDAQQDDKSNPSDYTDNGEVKYYLIRKEQNRINLASSNEVKGLNELISNALASQKQANKYQTLQINLSPPNQQSIHPGANMMPSLPPNFIPTIRDNYQSGELNTYEHWGWTNKQIPFSQLSLKQKMRIKRCEKMLKKVHIHPSPMLLPVYRGKNGWNFGLK